jgi:hypothetical protein
VTTPVIDVDFAVPITTISAGMPSIDVAIPGITGPPGSSSKIIVFGTKGNVTGSQAGTIPFYPRIAGDIIRVTAAVSGQASGTTRVDVNINGVTIYTDQTQRPNLNGVGQHFDDGGTAANATFTANDYITVDRDSSGVGATDLIVTVEYE